MQLIDAHTHLHFPEFREDLDAVIKRAQEAGVRNFILAGTNNETSWQAIELSRKYESMYATVGIHPHESHRVTPFQLTECESWLADPKVVAVGEVGLDYYRNLSPKVSQRETLINFFKMAERHKKPLMLHIRDAYDDMIAMLRDYFHPPIRGVAHCFSGTTEDMAAFVQFGFHISFAAPVTYPKNDALREAVHDCPLSRLLVETDAPYLPPQSVRGKRNEPAFVKETAVRIAEIRRMPPEVLGEQLVHNLQSLFGIG